MFGYLKPDKSKLQKGELGLYQTFLCGICMSTKKQFGNTKRILVNYDINFFNILLHSYLNLPFQFANQRCIASPVKKRSIMKTDELTEKLSAANIVLAYHKAVDDENDEGGYKAKLAKSVLKGAYKKAAALVPEIDEIILRQNKELSRLEKNGESNIDKLSHCFALLSKEMVQAIVPNADETLLSLVYNTGKWIYLTDALDDMKKDLKNRQFNAFLSAYGNIGKVRENAVEVGFVLNATLNKAITDYNDLNLQYYGCLLNNLFYFSLREKTNALLQAAFEE